MQQPHTLLLHATLACSPQGVRTPLDMVRSPSLPYAAVFDLPLSKFFMWVFPDYSKPYPETYELVAYLLQRYVRWL